MSQISPPLRFLLIGSVLFLAVYMLVLRPGGAETAAPAPVATPAAASTPASAPGQVVQGAQDAAATAEAAGAAAAGETPATATAPGTTAAAGAVPETTAKPIEGEVDTKGLPKPVARAVEANKVLVLLFWNPKAADDRAVRAELRDIKSYGNRVVVHVADVARISRYAAIAQGVDVAQSPSVVVVDGKRRATLLTGYTDTASIDQAVADALGLDALIVQKPTNAYFKSVDRLCQQADAEIDLPSTPAPGTFAKLLADGAAVSAVYDAKFAKLDTPKRFKGFAKDFAAYNARGTAVLKRAAADAGAAGTPAEMQVVAQRVSGQASAIQASGAERFGRYGIPHCLG
ncbi:MAG TPA: hypothetical protein VF587_03735 [Solirubrobacteraceae bacterium]